MGRLALAVGAVAAILYPIPLQLQGTTYYQTVGFLVLINAMLGLGWNVIGGWAGQFDFGPQVFFGVGAGVGVSMSAIGFSSVVAAGLPRDRAFRDRQPCGPRGGLPTYGGP